MKKCERSTWSRDVWKKVSKIYEAILRQDFLKELSDGSLSREAFSRYIAQDEIETNVESSIVTNGYNAHICEGISTGNPCLALAAVLPCMWIYNCVGLHILQHSSLEGNPYKDWILEYGNDEFTEGVNQVLRMIDEMAAASDKQTRERMDYYFMKSALYEYAFWDYGYNADAKSYVYVDSLEEWQ